MRDRAPLAPVRHLAGAPAHSLTNPTLWLWTAVHCVFGLTAAAFHFGALGAVPAVLVQTAVLYAAYTVTHESAHGLAHPVHACNEWMGRSSAFLQGITLPLYRLVHMQHHAHTNDPERDPDFVVARRPQWLLPVWLAIRCLHDEGWLARRDGWRNRSAARREHVLTRTLQLALPALLLASGHGELLAVCWLVPMAAAALLVNFVVAWAVHTRDANVGPLAASRNYVGVVGRCLSLNQCLHLVHHLWVGIPWFRYQRAVAAIASAPGAPGVRASTGTAAPDPSCNRY